MIGAITIYDPSAVVDAARFEVQWLALGAAVLVVVASAAALWIWVRRRQKRSMGDVTLRMLSARVGLRPGDRAALKLLAERAGCGGSPASVVLCRSVMSRGLKQIGEVSARDHRRIRRVAARLGHEVPARTRHVGAQAGRVSRRRESGTGRRRARGT